MNFFGWVTSRSRMVALGLEGRSATPASARPGMNMPHEYAALHKYLEARYASLVVLTFEQIESLLGFSLPDAARTDGTWWTLDTRHAEAWAQARRSATPNLLARNVAFERLP
jgi:hypothetical protein